MRDLMFEQTVDYGDNVAFHPDSQDPQKATPVTIIDILKIFMNL